MRDRTGCGLRADRAASTTRRQNLRRLPRGWPSRGSRRARSHVFSDSWQRDALPSTNSRGPPMDIAIVPTEPEHIESFHRALDIVARERKYLALLEAPPLTQTREFVMGFLQKGGLQFVALADGEVVGWCDIQRHGFPSRAHRGTLGMGIVPAYRGRGLGLRLIQAALAQAWAAPFVRGGLDVQGG